MNHNSLPHDIRFVFWGTPFFARAVLDTLKKQGVLPIALVCSPDKPVGRKQLILPSPAEVFAKENNIPFFQPNVLDDTFQKTLSELGADVFLIAAYARIIPKEFLSIPPHGTIGIHPSLLPLYRGASPIQSSILSGERMGVSLYCVDEKMDHGGIIAQKEVAIPEQERQYTHCEEHLAQEGATLFLDVIQKLFAGTLVPKEQDHTRATFTQKFVTEDGRVDLTMDNPLMIFRKIMALSPDPGVYTMQNGKRVKLLDARLENDAIVITRIVIEGKKPSEANLILPLSRL